MYLIDDNTGRCVGAIDVVRTDGPDIMGGFIVRLSSIEITLDTGRELEFLAKDLYVDILHNYHIRKFSEKAQGSREDYYKDTSKRCAGASAQKAKEKSQNDILDEILELIGSAKNTIKDLDKVRSNGLAFNGCQIDALIKLNYAIECIGVYQKEQRRFIKMYTKRQKVNIDDTRFIFTTNFSGDPSRDRFGSDKRRVNVVIPTQELADQLVALGVKVRQTKPNPERTYDEPFVPTYFAPVTINMESKWPPHVYWITTTGKRLLCDIDTIGQLDFIRVKNVCVQANLVEKRNTPGEYSLYADVMYVEQDADADPYAERYARYAAPEANMAEPSDHTEIPF